ncbi:carbon monoxide dehydrogenase maturation protein [Amycolatopsis sp. 195334CR]|uniref:MinD/ParA family ATP-binding protein n=1 Tax=Amycolatopsis sp. 195334CR TaxID=2814588 RepID=UPI001A8FF397|nr:carbon monoxide dehydrogenase maturation protein [Amycolatopsis sp. 195334CR]MBN6034165.1 carbon monoxide dehydrogenase maturation protein [Amycolatopsis sp. 195334CR]
MLIALCSLHGSPGVTALAVALVWQWPKADVVARLVAEVDPAGGDLAMRFGLPITPGLVSLAAASRRPQKPAVVWEHTQFLPGGARALVAPPGGTHARAVLCTLVAAQGGALVQAVSQEPGVVVLADCGRIDPGSPAEPIARRADALVVVTGSRADDLAHTAARLGDLARWTPRPGLLLVGDGYATAEVERELGVPTIGRIPHDPAAAAALTGHPPRERRRGARGLARQTAALARALAAPTPAGPLVPNTEVAVPGVPPQLVRQPDGTVAPGPQPLRAPPLPSAAAGKEWRP